LGWHCWKRHHAFGADLIAADRKPHRGARDDPAHPFEFETNVPRQRCLSGEHGVLIGCDIPIVDYRKACIPVTIKHDIQGQQCGAD
jgi:hypothetical protein